ncbi:NUDIX hydrolase [Candidatus Uhrbacteria bacterium]|nr:NUDIX hydrolase [Candidatus Uhrbacteria bacterium]
MLSDHAIAHIGQYALIKNGKNQVLVLENTELNACGLPGGRLEEGEHWMDSLMREVKEECNLDCTNPKPFGVHLVEEGEFIKYCVYFTVQPTFPLAVRVDNAKYRPRWISKKTVGTTRFYNDDTKKVVHDFLHA